MIIVPATLSGRWRRNVDKTTGYRQAALLNSGFGRNDDQDREDLLFDKLRSRVAAYQGRNFYIQVAI